MQKYINAVADKNGKPVKGATVLVLNYPSGTTATIYADNNLTALANPITSDLNGAFGFYAADGRYSLQISGSGIATQTINDILLEDPVDGGSPGSFTTLTVATSATLAGSAIQTASTLAASTTAGIIGSTSGTVQAALDARPTNASLAQPGTAANIGTAAGTVQSDIDASKDQLNAITLADYTALRAYAGSSKTAVITGYLGTSAPSGIAGTFTRDDSDTTSADNGGTIIVASNGKRWKRVYAGPLCIEWFGPKADGTTDDTSVLAALFAAAPSNGEIRLTPGKSFAIGSVNFSGKPITLRGYGATVVCTSATGSVYKMDHGNKLSVFGVNFTGTGAGLAINHQVTPSANVYDEMEVEDCTFDMGSGVYGIYCVGSREPRIARCTFKNTNSGCGIYFKDCVSPFLFQNIFLGTNRVGRAVYYPGSGNGTDAGLVLRDCEIMGWDKGVEIVGCDWFHISGCTIDYNNQSTKIAAQDGGALIGNYLGSYGATAALWITYDAGPTAPPNFSDKIIVEGNHFTGHYTGGNTYDCVLIDGATSSDNIQIKNNSFAFYTRYGVNFNMNGTRLLLDGNTFAQRTGFGVSPVYCQLGSFDANVNIKDNYFANGATITGMNLLAAVVNDNFGCTLSGSGQQSIAVAGTSVTFAHGITGYVPLTKDVFVTPLNQYAAAAQFYVSNVDATNITVSSVSAVASFAGAFAWRCSRYKA